MPVTPTDVDNAVPSGGIPNRGLTNTVLKGLITDIANVGIGVGVGTVNTFADLPAVASHTGERWWVLTSTGVWLVNRKTKGAYYSDGVTWSYLGDFPVTAVEIGNTPAGDISAVNVQAAIDELDTEKAPKGSITTSSLTQATARLLGRWAVGTGAIQEVTVGDGLLLTGSGVLEATHVGTRIEDEGATVVAAATALNFAGAGVVVTDAGSGEALVTIVGGGGGGSITVQDEGTPLTTAVTLFNFVGAGVTVTEPVTDQVTVTISGGGSIAVPTDTRSGAYTLVAGDAQRRQRVNGATTVPNSVFTAGDIVMLHSYSASVLDVTQGTGVTLRLGGSTVTGSCKLAPRGVAIIVFDTASDCTIQGAVM